MVGKNRGIYHSCRKRVHYLLDCPTKKLCLKCGHGFEKCMEVEKNTSNIGRLFLCCTRDCGYFQWKDEEQSVANSSCACSDKSKATYPCQDLSCMFNKCAQITEEKDIEISINITMRKGKEMGLPRLMGKEREKLSELVEVHVYRS